MGVPLDHPIGWPVGPPIGRPIGRQPAEGEGRSRGARSPEPWPSPGRWRPIALAGLILVAGLAAAVAPAAGQTPKRGGVLNAMLAEDPPSLSIHESSTISGVWPVAPCYSNLVLFDPFKPAPPMKLRQVGVEASVKQMETSAYFPALARRDYQIGANLTAGVVDDPDAYFYENYKCGSPRNYTEYCSEEMDRLIDLQSQELDRGRRLQLVWQIQKKLEADVARPMLGWRKEYFTQWPHVRNLVPHNALYSYGRMQEVGHTWRPARVPSRRAS